MDVKEIREAIRREALQSVRKEIEEWRDDLTCGDYDEGYLDGTENALKIIDAAILSAEPAQDALSALSSFSTIDTDAIRRECLNLTKIRQGILRVTLNDCWTNEEIAQSVYLALANEPAQDDGKPEVFSLSEAWDAFEAGYMQGHNDTVESCVRDSKEAAMDYFSEVKRRIEEAWKC